MADLFQLDHEGKSVGLTPMNLSKTTIARFFRVHEDGLHLKMVKNGKCENVWPLSNGKFLLLPTGTKMHMWLPFLLKIKIYKRMMMMIFTEHLVLRTYVFLCLGFIFFFNVSFRYFIRRKYLKARFDR